MPGTAGGVHAARPKKRGPRVLRPAAPAIKPRRRPTLPQARPAVPSAMGPFTSVFGMGTGVASPPWPPGKPGPGPPARKIKTTHSQGGSKSRAASGRAGIAPPAFNQVKLEKRPSLTAD